MIFRMEETAAAPDAWCSQRQQRLDSDRINAQEVSRMKIGLTAAGISLFAAMASAQTTANEETPRISLDVPSGAPLRLYLTKRISKRAGAPVEAKLLEPVFAFDREVVPAGTIARVR